MRITVVSRCLPLFLAPFRLKRGEAEKVSAEVEEQMESIAKLITPQGVVAEYGLALETQRDLRKRGGFAPVLKIGRRLYYRREGLEAWLDEQRVVSTHHGAETVGAPLLDEVMEADDVRP